MSNALYCMRCNVEMRCVKTGYIFIPLDRVDMPYTIQTYLDVRIVVVKHTIN